MRLHRGVLDESSAGRWLAGDLGLVLCNGPSGWYVHCTLWLSADCFAGGGSSQDSLLLAQRCDWVADHGLNQAQFPTRRAALQALEYALARDPLPELQAPAALS